MSNPVSAVGVWFYAQSTDRYLYLMRSDPKHPDSWGLPGGKMEVGETLLGCLERECTEELGSMPAYTKIVPIEKFTSADGGFAYHTFFCSIEQEFIPVLNSEHSGYAWLSSGNYPKPMHPGLWSTVNFSTVKEKVNAIKSLFQ